MLLSGFVSDMKVKLSGIVTLPIISPVSSEVTREIFFHYRVCVRSRLFKQVHNIQSCVTLLANLECVRNIRKISRALVSQVDLMTFNDKTVTSLTQSVHRVPIAKRTKLKMFWWSWKLPVSSKTQMIWLNGLATSWLVINKANLRDLIAGTGLVISNWIQIVNFSARVTVKFDGWPCKTIGHLFYATSSFVHLFVPIGEFKLKLQSGNAQSGSNWMIFRAVRPWNLTDDLAKQ